MSVEREHWKSQLGFMLACIASAVGLGNIWRFNYLAYKWGGGTFILVYIFAILTAAVPIVILEYGLGHRFRRVAPLVFRRISRPLEVIGWIPSVQMVFLVSYYCVVLAWVLNYLIYAPTLAWGTDTNDFFFNQFLQASDSVWDLKTLIPAIAISLFAVWFTNWWVISRGLQQGMELFSKILMPVLAVLALILVVRGVTLPGADIGIRAYLTPDWTKLGQPRLWVDAFSQIFFSISAAFGILIAFASYLPRRTRLVGSAMTLALANSGYFEIFLGFASFGTLGHLALVSGKPIDEVMASGIGFAFVAFPEALSKMPIWPGFFATCFFLLVFFAGISSSMSLIEAITTIFWDKFRWARKSILRVFAIFGFVLGLLFVTRAGIYALDIVDHYISSYVLLFVGVMECVIVGYIWGVDKLIAHLNRQPGIKLQSMFHVIMTYIVPLILLTIAYFLAVTNYAKLVPALERTPEAWLLLGIAHFIVPAIIVVGALALSTWSARCRHNEQYIALIKYWIPGLLTLIFYQGWFGEFKEAYGAYPAGALAFFGGGFLLHIVLLAFILTHSRGHPRLEEELAAEEAALATEEASVAAA